MWHHRRTHQKTAHGGGSPSLKREIFRVGPGSIGRSPYGYRELGVMRRRKQGGRYMEKPAA